MDQLDPMDPMDSNLNNLLTDAASAEKRLKRCMGGADVDKVNSST